MNTMTRRCQCTVFAVVVLSTQLAAIRHQVGQHAPQNERRGIVYVIGGVGGYDPLPMTAPMFLSPAGIEHDFVGFTWTHGVPQFLKDLQDTRQLERMAGNLAELIRIEKKRHPEKRIYILANSGGTGLALRAAEMLPSETVERIVLMAAAVSPAYDLRPALQATARGIVSYYSPLDRIVLDWGTRQFGTMDRHYVTSAGCIGFEVPTGLSETDRALYARLVQIRWRPNMLLLGHFGGHKGVHSPLFLMLEVSRWFCDDPVKEE